MPLEKVLRRLNIRKETELYYCQPEPRCRERKDDGYCTGHNRLSPWVGYPFDGWTLAWYVQKWHEQVPDGKAPALMQSNERDAFRKWPDFKVYSSDD